MGCIKSLTFGPINFKLLVCLKSCLMLYTSSKVF